MRFAQLNDQRCEAQPGLHGTCPCCTKPVVARCGRVRVWHWAHRSVAKCDRWWEKETEWHRAWKDRFPKEWQERIFRDANGDTHIADVMTPHGRAIEFQHSGISMEERSAREAFYGPKMVWIVDGLARKRDLQSFHRALILVDSKRLTYVAQIERCALLRDWAPSTVSVFFDFGMQHLWYLPAKRGGHLLIRPISLDSVIKLLVEGTPAKPAPAKPAPPRRIVKARTAVPRLPPLHGLLRELAAAPRGPVRRRTRSF